MADEISIPADIAEMTFEQALAALEEIVSKLETGNAPLEQSIDLYTRGTALKQHCVDKLKSAQARVEKISVGEGGQANGVEPFDVD